MNEIEEIQISPSRKAAGNICAGVSVVLCGVFLLLCGVNVIPFTVQDALAASILSAVGLAFLAGGLIQKNPVSVWLAAAFLTPVLVEILAKTTSATYGNLYPIYIAIPAVACLATALIFRKFKPHLYPVIFFGGLSMIFALQSSRVAGWSVAAPCVVVFAGLCVLLLALKSYKNKDKNIE
ncbi:MAG: hypothetical protein FWH03_00260 [Firmicutes bacterium]|nr:hypothetical protein [Bacillota bacterium]